MIHHKPTNPKFWREMIHEIGLFGFVKRNFDLQSWCKCCWIHEIDKQVWREIFEENRLKIWEIFDDVVDDVLEILEIFVDDVLIIWFCWWCANNLILLMMLILIWFFVFLMLKLLPLLLKFCVAEACVSCSSFSSFCFNFSFLNK
jgi:hypothetical protein